jgi:transcriptional regulator with XRE-family HTH domain
MVPLQIRVLRRQRDWSQSQLAKESKVTQGVISRAEDPNYGNLTVNTLVRIAAGFDCAYVGRFVPFSELGKWYTALTSESALEVPSFAADVGFIERKEARLSAFASTSIRERFIFCEDQSVVRFLSLGEHGHQTYNSGAALPRSQAEKAFAINICNTQHPTQQFGAA